jgi:hypothetical protein
MAGCTSLNKSYTKYDKNDRMRHVPHIHADKTAIKMQIFPWRGT